jgi:hypothetical protein
VIRFADEHGEIEIDLRYTPLYLCRWRGRLSHSIVTELFAFSAEVADRALAQMMRVAYVNDVDEIERPDGEVRRLIAELSVDLERNGQRIAMVGSWQIIRNPVIRGVLKAASWVSNGLVDGNTAADWNDGIRRAVLALEAAGQPVPALDPSSYRFPVRVAE